jgi:hypothetical protein
MEGMASRTRSEMDFVAAIAYAVRFWHFDALDWLMERVSVGDLPEVVRLTLWDNAVMCGNLHACARFASAFGDVPEVEWGHLAAVLLFGNLAMLEALPPTAGEPQGIELRMALRSGNPTVVQWLIEHAPSAARVQLEAAQEDALLGRILARRPRLAEVVARLR